VSLLYTNAVFQCAVPVKPVARLVMLVLADHADENGESYPSIRRIVEMTRATRRSVQYAIRDLEREGLIRTVIGGRNRDGSSKRSNRYRIQISRLADKGATIAPIGRERAQPLHPEGATIAPEPSLNRQIEPSIEPSSLQGEGERGSFHEVTAEMIYAAYPRRVEKAAALKAIRDVIKLGKAPTWLLARVYAFAAAVDRWPVEAVQFVPYPAKWFRNGCFDDDPRQWERRADAEAVSAAGTHLVLGPDGEPVAVDSHGRPLRQKTTTPPPALGMRATEDQLRGMGILT